MTEEDYMPASELLQRMVREDVEVEAHGAEVIALTRDADGSNRDWALLLLAQSELASEEVLEALIAGMDDANHEAGLEALIGVAMRAPEVALPRVKALIEADTVESMALEAAAYVASPALMPALDALAAEFGEDDDKFGMMLAEAIAACSTGTRPEPI